MTFTARFEIIMKRKYRAIKNVEYNFGTPLVGYPEGQYRAYESVRIRLTFRGPTPSQGPLEMIQELFCGKVITAKYIELQRGRPRRSSSDSNASEQSNTPPSSFGSSTELDYMKNAAPTQKISLIDSKDFPSGPTFQSSSFEYLPSTALPAYNLPVSNEADHLSNSLGILDHNDLYHRPLQEDPMRLESVYTFSNPPCETELDSLSSTGHSMSSSSGHIKSMYIGSDVQVPTDDLVRPNFSRWDGSELMTYPYGSAQGTVVSGPYNWLPQLNVRIMTNCRPFKGSRMCTLVFSGKKKPIQEVIGGSVVAGFHVDTKHSLIVHGSIIVPCSSPCHAISNVMVPGLKQIFPQLNAMPNIKSATANVEICLHLSFSRVVQFASTSLQVQYARPEILPALPETSYDNSTAGGKIWGYSGTQNPDLRSTTS